MPKRLSKNSHPQDVNQAAFQMVHRATAGDESTDHPANVTKSDISRVMAAMGRKGGKIGGKRRLETLTPERRSEIAIKAAESRWAKHSEKK
jgi:hypothetical protein